MARIIEMPCEESYVITTIKKAQFEMQEQDKLHPTQINGNPPIIQVGSQCRFHTVCIQATVNNSLLGTIRGILIKGATHVLCPLEHRNHKPGKSGFWYCCTKPENTYVVPSDKMAIVLNRMIRCSTFSHNHAKM